MQWFSPFIFNLLKNTDLPTSNLHTHQYTHLPTLTYGLFLPNYLPSALTVCTCSLAHITQHFFVF